MAAFVISRYTFKGRELIYGLFTLGLLFPAAVAILPLFITLRQVGLLSNPLGVALPQAAFGLPIAIVIMRPFFRAIPQELQDAAAIDGCKPLRFYWSIMLPLSRPVLSTVAVITIVGSWNAFLLPLLVLVDPSQHTLPIGVNNISAQYTTDYAKAKQLLADAGYPGGGFTLQLTYTSENSNEANFTPLIKEAFAKVGVTVNIKALLNTADAAKAREGDSYFDLGDGWYVYITRN